jgi:hypothetical protein
VRGGLWVASYVMLYAAVLATLAVSLAVARQVGRILQAPLSRDLLEKIGPGLVPGTGFPDIEVVDVTTGDTLRPGAWTQGAIVQTVIFERDDVQRLSRLAQSLGSGLASRTVLSINASHEELIALSQELRPLRLTNDPGGQLQAALRSKLRPYGVVLARRTVVAARQLGGLGDLEEMINEALGPPPEVPASSTSN